ncbi:hypothetical protein EIL87_05815 [Saccharopolyspora rhizosphaerae]|uniref:Uncharacterized protein n=1 Tax=Saccharopolyspora rhizosphaerae TaxID=2492662 RepID=A0A3R8QDP0_9PSEU|nr:DUF5872 domain-containing protein [Saccharopolyspora rhizosphaerae]RRO18634.1 hypothetical protein EIL87_05815 [Saccharopolyspora rhizosphaerae]
MAKSKKDYERDYTDPTLRERLKEEIKASDKGGAAGQWSARKSQLLVQEYEKQGGGYRFPEQRSGEQRSLEEWTEQDWRTDSGSAQARHDGETERYLPKSAWEEMSPSERREAKQTKRAGSRQGKQHTANPPAAKNARKAAELDSLSAKEAVKRARDMSPRQAQAALRHERDHKARKTVLRQLDKAAHQE